MTEMQELKPCPFCGTQPEQCDYTEFTGGYTVRCDNPSCQAIGRLSGKREKAVNAWNNRTGVNNITSNFEINENELARLKNGEAEQVMRITADFNVTDLMFAGGRVFARYTVRFNPNEYFVMEILNKTPNKFTCDPSKVCSAKEELEGIKERLDEFKSMI